MIVDKLVNASKYYSLNPALEVVFKYIQNQDLENLKPGKYNIDNIQAKVSIQEYYTRYPEEVEWEAHKLHYDIQYLIQGTERIGYAPIDGMEPVKPYEASSDKLILSASTGDFITLRGDLFVIMLPEDAHQPRVAVDKPGMVKKIIVKVLA
ncbi:MAG TPA: YhcH/YjgK/YiaL family protein [Bacillota bacterium]|nr:YhcH/YjgK/YiaL family protein [Bacillota bacterium]